MLINVIRFWTSACYDLLLHGWVSMATTTILSPRTAVKENAAKFMTTLEERRDIARIMYGWADQSSCRFLVASVSSWSLFPIPYIYNKAVYLSNACRFVYIEQSTSGTYPKYTAVFDYLRALGL